LKDEMSKKCTPLWREAHVEIKLHKTPHVRPLLEVGMWKKCVTVEAGSSFPIQTVFGPLLEVQMSNECTPLWREERFQITMFKAPHVGTAFERSGARFCLAGTRNCASCQRLEKHEGFVAVSTTTPIHYTTLHYTTLRDTTLHYTQVHYTTTTIPATTTTRTTTLTTTTTSTATTATSTLQ